MAAYTILTDSCCDLPAELAAELELEVLPLRLEMSGSTYRNYLDGREIGFQEFYSRIRGGENAVTSAVSVGDFETAMRAVLDRGEDLLCICFSSALSATYQSAAIAADSLREAYPDRTLYVVDSLCASMGQGLLVWLCAQEKRNGKSIREVRDFAEQQKGSVCHWFTVDDLYHLKRGGRVSATTALFGTMLSIKPVLHVDAEGRLIPMEKARGRKASLTALVDQMEETAVSPGYQTVFISHGDCLDDAKFVASEIRRRFGTQNIIIDYIGPVIGSHTGAGVVALFFTGSSR
ncbi:MAG: DegV family protein [Oscillibacter sp.]|jgi:DegV family protein with EDD domain|nr:DegV family protein [Oscillibacter sp.]